MAENVLSYVIPLSAQKPRQLTLLPAEPNSRYKTRQLQVQIVGKNKMMKTVLVNILDVAKDLQVPPSYIGTFMGYEIGAQAKWDPKKPERQQAFLSGEHDTKDLSKIALQFIQEVILCPNCALPEIVTEVDTVSSKVQGRCRACGSLSDLRISNEKFKRYILNHPPSTKGDSFSGSKNVDKKEAAVKKHVAKQIEREQAAEKIEIPHKKNSKKEEDDEPVVWFSDTSDEAARARRELMLPDAFTKVKRLPEVSEVKAVIDSPDKVQELKSSCNLSDAEFIPVLFSAIVANNADSLAPLVKQKELLKKFTTSSDSQVALLGSVEKFVGEINTALLAKVSHIIKELYDEELLDEENIILWFEDNTNAIAKVREGAAPIVKWLKEAEQESEEEDD